MSGKVIHRHPVGAGSVVAARPAIQRARGGAEPTPALQISSCILPRDLSVRPIDSKTARRICEKHHYLGSYPGGGLLNFGIFADHALVGVAVFAAGPYNVHRYFTGAKRGQVITLSRFWLEDRCGRNSESRILGVICRLLRRWQNTAKAIVAYSDPEAGHDGAIYRAAGFLYLGFSVGMQVYRLRDGSIHHSRSISHRYGTHSLKYLRGIGVSVEAVPQQPKYLYVTFLDPDWRERLRVPALPFSKSGDGQWK